MISAIETTSNAGTNSTSTRNPLNPDLAADEAWLAGATTVGVTSGASVPEILVEGVLGKLAALGFDDVEEVEAVKEHMAFQLPRELRK